MGAYNVVNRASLAAGQPEDVSAVLSNLDAIAAVLNGNIDNTNLAAGILASKLAGYPADATKALFGDSTWKAPVAAGMSLIADSLLAVDTASPFDTNTILGGNIPQTFKHLRLIMSLRSTAALTFEDTCMRINNDATANYTYTEQYNQNNTTSAGGAVGQNKAHIGYTKAATGSAGMFSTYTIDIPDYTNAANLKSWTSQFSAPDAAIANHITGETGGGWYTAAAIIRLQVLLTTGPSFKAGSRFSLYGIS